MEKIDTEVSPMAAANNFYYKSLPELQRLAEGYKSPLSAGVSSTADPVYTVEDVSREEFHNITTFLYNASVKDSRLVSSSESDLSSAFSSYLKKYMEEGLTLSEVVGLKNFVTGYNGLAFSHLYNNVYGYVYGVSQETAAGIDPNSFYGRIVKDIKDRLSFIVSKTQNTSSKTAEEWLTGSDTGISTKVYTASEFLDYIQKSSGIIEAVVLLEIISYINMEDLPSGGGAFEFDGSSVVRDSSINLTEEPFFDLYSISTAVKDLVFSTESASVVESAQGTNTLESIRISDSLGRIILTLKYRRLDSSDNLLEQFLFVTPTSGAISFTSLISAFREQLNNFVDDIKLTSGLTAEYEEKISYFLRDSNDVLLENILSNVRSSVRTIFYKDTIIESQRIGLGSGQKLSALPSEISSAQAQNQILVIDARNVDFSTDATALAAAEQAFGSEVGDTVIIEEATEESEAIVDYNKVTYTVIYKELNQALRPLLLSEVQDYVLSRMVEDLGIASLLQVDGNGVSYDEAIEDLFRAHRDSQELFKLGPELSRYRFFYGNGYNARRFAESEIIGYYIGNSSSESAFTNNYGRYDYQRVEINSFLDTYRSTRDYYYRVLLNKSFMQDSAYPVYEKLFIAWAAIERFLSSKIDNLRDPDLFNDEDIFNFLESYGLGVLNQYDFSLPNGRNYKTNIIKYFNQLIRLKGSKDVIPLLARVFDVDDATLEVKKFLLVDAAESTYPEAASYDIELARDYEIWLKTTETWAAETLSADEYFYSETDSLVYFYDHDGTGLVWSSNEPFTGTSGGTVPLNTSGEDGDYFLKSTTTRGLYEKISGVWTAVTPSAQTYFYSETDGKLYVYTSSWDNGSNGIVGTSGEATPTGGSNGDYYLKEGKIYVLFEGSNTDIIAYDPERVYYYDGGFVYSDGSTASVSTDYVFDEQTFNLYSLDSTLTEAAYTFVNRQPEDDVLAEDEIVFDEIAEKFYIGVDNAGTIEADEITSLTMVSVVDTLPAATQDRSAAQTSTTRGSIYYSNSTSKFYEKTSWGWDALKVSSEYPEVISSNIGLTIPSGSSLSEQIKSYDGNYFYQTDEITGLPSSLLQFNLSTGSVVEIAEIPFETTESLPSRPGEIDVKLGRVLIKQGVISRSYLTTSQPVEYSPVAYILEAGADSNRRFVDINSKISSFATIEDGYETALYVQSRTAVGASDLRFVEVPYSSDNGTREINNALGSGIPYEDFVSRNVAEGTDPYWTLDNVPASTLEGLGLDAVETKYLSLTISENVYRNYAVSRYLLSAIERLESAFKIDTDGDSSLSDETPVTSRISIESGVVGESTLYDFFQAAKVLFKANVAIYSAQGEDFSLRGYDSTKIRYYGVNPSTDWNAVVDAIRAVIPNFDDIEENFLEDEYKTSDLLSTSWGSTTPYDKFSLYQKTDNPIDYGSGRAYRKDLVVDGEKQLNTVSGIIRDVAFSTIKLNQAIQQQNSGELALETIENLNTIRLENDLLWDYFLSKYYNDDYSIVDAGLRSRQLSEKLPEASELYYKVIEDMIRFPIQVFDGLLNESYNAQNKNLSKDFVDFATAIFDEVYTQEARKNWEFASSSFGTAEPSSANKGEYFYNTDDDELFVYSGSSWGSALTIKATGTHGLATPENSFGSNNDYFLNITNDILYRKVTGVWTAQSYTFGDIFVDTTEERVIVCLPEDPALFSETSFSNTSIQEYVSDALDILNGVTPVPTSAAELEALAESFTQKLLSLSDSLESIFSSEEFMRLRFSLNEAEQQTISFVETSVKLFLSYTSQLYSSRYRREFNTQSESAPLSDRILHTIQGVRADYVLYDEMLEIEKEE